MMFLLALLAMPQLGSISGTVVDASTGSIAGATVKLAVDSGEQQTQSLPNGSYSFSNVAPGPYRLSFTASGFAEKSIQGVLAAAETASLAPVVLSLAAVSTDMTVFENQTALAQVQIKEQEQQRIGGLVPNYFVTYNADAAPLNARQKFELSWHTFFDPSAFVITGVVAGVGQARNSHKGFGQGGQGYAKRYGAAYADFVTGTIIGSVVMPTVFKQDPRYFYKGTGTTRQRVWYAINRSVICRGDNKKDQFCYSSFVSRFASGALSNYYYPAVDRDSAGTVVQNAVIGIGADALGNLFQEFLARKITRKKH